MERGGGGQCVRQTTHSEGRAGACAVHHSVAFAMGNKSSSHLPPRYPRDMPPYYLNPPPPTGHPLCPGPPPMGHPYAPPPFHHSMMSLHHPHGTDSGYMTSPADTERWKAQNWKHAQSRLSLNEAFMYETAPPPPFMAMPPPNPKQLKKWQKKHKKLLKKMASMPPPIMPSQPPPVPPYTRAYSMENLNSQVLDGYAELPAVNKRGWKNRKEQRKSHHFGEVPPEVPAGPPRSTVSSSCSNGFVISDSRGQTSAPSTNLSDHSRVTSTNTEHSPVIRPPSSLHSKGSPMEGKRNSTLPGLRIRSRPESTIDRTTIIEGHEYHPSRAMASSALHVRNDSRADHSAANRAFKATATPSRSREAGAVPLHHNDIHMSNSQFTAPRIEDKKTWTQAERYGEVDSDRQPSHGEYRIEEYNSMHMGDVNDSMSTERTIPIKITPEAKKILERNAQLFPRNETSDIEPIPEVSKDEKSETALSNDNSLPSNPTSRHFSPAPSTPLAFTSLKRNAEYGSTISSLTQSSNMKTEVSDIDFSWVNDVENRLDKEIAFVKEDYPRQAMPVRYFGMDVGESPRSVPKAPGMQPSEAFLDSEHSRELNGIRSDVRSKAAMFDVAAMRTAPGNSKPQPEMGARYRSRSMPRGDPNMYIPQPDYNSYEPISVDTSHSDSHRYFGVRPANDVGGIAASPSERRMRKIENTNGVANSQVTFSAHDAQNARYGRSAVPSRNADDYRNEALQRNRTYDATEYYRQNAARRQSDKPWRASVAY